MSKAKAPVAKLNAMHHIGYGAGDAGGVLMLMMISYLEYFSRNILGVSSYVYAAILLVWNIWDMINDPLVGTFMDIRFAKAKNKSNKFRPWILRSIPIMAIGMGSLFFLPTLFDGLLCIVVLFVSKIVFELGYIMNIGMGSLLGVMATNDAERASLSSARGFGSTVGGMIGMMAIPQVLKALGTTALGYAVTAVVAVVLGLVVRDTQAGTQSGQHLVLLSGHMVLGGEGGIALVEVAPAGEDQRAAGGVEGLQSGDLSIAQTQGLDVLGSLLGGESQLEVNGNSFDLIVFHGFDSFHQSKNVDGLNRFFRGLSKNIHTLEKWLLESLVYKGFARG